MTFSWWHNSTQDYQFTALVGTDILRSSDNELGCGETFTMPASANASITVTDNDTTLSGDASRNESGDDTSWQKADIRIDGKLVAQDVRIYAEEFYTLATRAAGPTSWSRSRWRGRTRPTAANTLPLSAMCRRRAAR